MRLDGYVRVSKVRGREGPSFISPSVQEERLRAYATATGHTVVRVHHDLDQPGDRIDRPGLQTILERLEGGEIDGLVVARLDRFARSGGDAANLIKRIRDAGGELLAAQESIDTSGPFGRFVVQILTAIGELELERIRENWATARRRAVERGVHLSGQPPLGYEKLKSGPEQGRLRPNEAAPFVKEMFERRAGGDSWLKIGAYLTENGVVTPWGNKVWTVATVRNVIGNRVYLGEARAGDQIVNTEAHEALVDATLFAQANAARGVVPARSGKSAGLLSGLLRCAGCSYAMKPASGKTRHGKEFREYRCKPDKAAGRCSCPTSAKAERVEAFVLERLFESADTMRAIPHSENEEILEAERTLAETELELAAALDDRLADTFAGDPSVYLAALERRQDAVGEAREALDQLRATSAPVAGMPATGVTLEEVWPDLSLEDQRKLLSSAFDAIFLRRPLRDPRSLAGRLHICWRGEAPELPVRGQRSIIRPFDAPSATWVPAAEDARESAREG